MSNPFSSTRSRPGHGIIHLALLPPNTPRLRTVEYQYPLKLISPAPITTTGHRPHLVHTVYLLTYGGGLVAGDTIDLHITIERSTRLTLLTQGSTKLFKSPSRDVVSEQAMKVDLAPGSGLCYLPDPVQPFEHSCFRQHQMYNIVLPPEGSELACGSLCALDWVCSGRAANGEDWSFYEYASRNEVFLTDAAKEGRLLLRDNMALDDHGDEGSLTGRMNGLAVFGTLILYGPTFQSLGEFFMDEFKQLPRIGGREWDGGSDDTPQEPDAMSLWRAARHRREAEDGVLWSAASVRGCVVVKFGARKVEHGRLWLKSMLLQEGSVVVCFGERAMLCLK